MLILAMLPPALLAAGNQREKGPAMTAGAFKDPPMQYRSCPFYWLNGKFDSTALRVILDDALPATDVVFENTPRLLSGGGMLSYLHKVKHGAQVFYFANSNNDCVDTWVRLRGKMTLQAWDPHIGAMTPLEFFHSGGDTEETTRVRLMIEPVKSVFLVEASKWRLGHAEETLEKTK